MKTNFFYWVALDPTSLGTTGAVTVSSSDIRSTGVSKVAVLSVDTVVPSMISNTGMMSPPAACISRVHLCGKVATLAVAHSTYPVLAANQWERSKSFCGF